MSVIMGFAKLCNGINDLSDLLESIKRLRNNVGSVDEIAFNRRSFGVEIVCIVPAIAGVVAPFFKVEEGKIQIINRLECLARVFKFRSHYSYGLSELQESDRSLITTMKIAERRFLGPFLSLLRVCCEGELCKWKKRSEMNDEDLAKEKEPIGEGLSESWKLPTYRNITHEECVQNCDTHSKFLSKILSIEAVTRTGCVSNVVGAWVREDAIRMAHQRLTPTQATAIPSAAAASADPLDLTRYDEILTEFLHDPFLSRYRCAITKEAIRHPLRDPNGVTLYERSAILAWLVINPISPVTRNPLAASQLQPVPLLAALIDARLRSFSIDLKQQASASQLKAASAALMSSAAKENPSY